ncbi:DNA repair protein RecO [bacterium]
MRYFSSDVIILKSRKSGERDRYLRILSSTFGKIGCIVRGINKSVHKYGSNLEPFSRQRIMIYRSKPSNRTLLTSAKIIDSHYSLRKDLGRFNTASLVVNIVETLIVDEGSGGAEIFDILDKTLTLLETESTVCVLCWFFFRVLSKLGYNVSFDSCVSCGQSPEGIVSISMNKDGITCRKCSNTHSNINDVSYNTYRVLRGIAGSPDYIEIKDKCNMLKKERENDLYNTVWKFINYYCEGRVKKTDYSLQEF